MSNLDVVKLSSQFSEEEKESAQFFDQLNARSATDKHDNSSFGGMFYPNNDVEEDNDAGDSPGSSPVVTSETRPHAKTAPGKADAQRSEPGYGKKKMLKAGQAKSKVDKFNTSGKSKQLKKGSSQMNLPYQAPHQDLQ